MKKLLSICILGKVLSQVTSAAHSMEDIAAIKLAPSTLHSIKDTQISNASTHDEMCDVWDKLSLLSDELVFDILSYLNKIERTVAGKVSKRLNNISKDKMLNPKEIGECLALAKQNLEFSDSTKKLSFQKAKLGEVETIELLTVAALKGSAKAKQLVTRLMHNKAITAETFKKLYPETDIAESGIENWEEEAKKVASQLTLEKLENLTTLANRSIGNHCGSYILFEDIALIYNLCADAIMQYSKTKEGEPFDKQKTALYAFYKDVKPIIEWEKDCIANKISFSYYQSHQEVKHFLKKIEFVLDSLSPPSSHKKTKKGGCVIS